MSHHLMFALLFFPCCTISENFPRENSLQHNWENDGTILTQF
jgi:hypothetical protein